MATLTEVGTQLDRFSRLLCLGPQIRARLAGEVESHTGVGIEDLALDRLIDPTRLRSILLVHGRDDRFAAYESTARLSRRWPAAELVTTTGLGHARLLADPAVVDRVVNALGSALPGAVAENAGADYAIRRHQ
jgi:pimeloyl-ACP methyl ester carboxylesterase